MVESDAYYDVVVVGAGNAALCAALAARDSGATVIMLEKAPPGEQGGNCPFTGGGFRFTHDGLDDLRDLVDLTDFDLRSMWMEPYTEDDFKKHLREVTLGDVDDALMDVVVSESRATVDWMHTKGVRWELPSRVRTSAGAPSMIPNRVALSAYHGGIGLIRMLTTATKRAGIQILYEAEMVRLIQNESGAVVGVEMRDAEGPMLIGCAGVVLACGGFEANAEMRAEHLGTGWDQAKVRGAKYNTGDGHRAAIAIGAKPFGHWDGCHATPVDADAPDCGLINLTDSMLRRSYPLGIMVNSSGKRFVDEGESFAEQTFGKVSGKILEQEGNIAYQIFDSRAIPLLELRYGTAKCVEANTIAELATALGISVGGLTSTVMAFNFDAKGAEYRPRVLDNLATIGVQPRKSNWAVRLDTPPFRAYTVTGGITYTYGGLSIDERANVLDAENVPISGLFAAGEIVGGIFYHNSLRAAGLMHGAVFGKIAGESAATLVGSP